MSTASELREKAEAIAADAPKVEARHPSLAAALVAALAPLIVVEKTGTGNYGSYADLADLGKAAKPALALHGLTYMQNLHAHGDGLAVTTTLLHEGGEREVFGPLSFPHGQNAPATGSYITYMRRYALAAALGLAPGDADDDGQAAIPAPPAWTYNDAKRRLFAAVKDDKRTAEQNKETAGKAWTALHGDDRWRDWEHGFPQADVDAWLNEPKDTEVAS